MVGRGPNCSIQGCRNYKIQPNRKSFFRFPRNKELCAEWVARSKNPNMERILETKGPDYMNKTYVVCSDHFQENDFRNKNLLSQGIQRNTVPSLMLYNDDPLDLGNTIKREREDLPSEISDSNPNEIIVPKIEVVEDYIEPTEYIEVHTEYVEEPAPVVKQEIENYKEKYENLQIKYTNLHLQTVFSKYKTKEEIDKIQVKYDTLKLKHRNVQKLLSKYKTACRKLKMQLNAGY